MCGRYEGIDQRVIDNFSNDTLSIGDYVLSGGELPALVVLESIARLLPGVLEKPDAPLKESFSAEGEIEYPQYTRPENFMGHKVPQVLLSGNHKKTEEWRRKNTTALPA
ncbi:MAG: tRNA (guanine-N(1)-)-methyltransferase [candidate division WWE3 bacterium GW2011_GWA2_46_9]|uniref:tRNA (guanine-N(1)-)-methyltransferase n=1 Tax=candidate division WWE3 bacterium GW2011_GWA2_46_9 TaxID=1619111 RepID=A0A0G1QVV0_UNCKA|nr:MAG: tRNA (guanine-N(1)-)-methyltransferase [candidate division WWE3 bacterium GW2011_GWA2_46_9]